MSGGGRGVGGRGVPAPQDERVSRRWFVERMAWVSSAAAAGTLFARTPAVASPHGPAVTPEAFAANVRLQEVDDLTQLTMSESMTLIRTGALDPRDLVEAYVDRIEAFEGTYQAYADRPSRETLLAQLARTPADERRARSGACASRPRTTATRRIC